ncbi:hypothetical protein GCM10027566_12600 [Arachidicoccus ginsenosidivorans]|jgi:molybdopterin synthase sulfur carrier subunit|uniref:Molybdopterin synthase sulfur carrier subunit n=1 Tax=Arachidicoccus ginsenosidivorans TaxID=496057 RepID=A0A5B8VK30_9BACT|nr:MoaD/ThiS family protein [Arachidicoccus ginsenosidivorans]QEC71325.1 MoaD/ThiS family protein [Arachidicoccus ginsenosidivorans]
MEVSILAFGIAKDIVKASKIKIELEPGADTRVLRKTLETSYPALAGLKSYMIAVNQQYANEDTLLKAQDEIAIIPPVSGG